MAMKNKFTKQDLQYLIKGACLLASGGGGTLSSSQRLVDKFTKGDYYQSPEFEIITKKEAVSKGGYAAVIAYIGAPDALESINYPDAAVYAAKLVQKYLKKQGKELSYVVPVETGALSMVVPCLVASKLNLPVIDCDGAGRAVPELTMLTYSAENVDVNPTFLTNDKGYSIQLEINTDDSTGIETQENAAESIENLVRPVLGLQQFNEIAGLGIWIMDKKTMQKAIRIEGTLTKSIQLGKALTDNCAEWNKDCGKLISYLNNDLSLKTYSLFEGQFVSTGCSNLTKSGFDHGQITIRNKAGIYVTTIFQNETLLAWKSDRQSPMVTAPDSIAYYVHNKQQVYSNGDIIDSTGSLIKSLKNVTVSVLGIAANDVLRQNEERRINTPLFRQRMDKGAIMKSFKKALLDLGYAGSYVPIEDENI